MSYCCICTTTVSTTSLASFHNLNNYDLGLRQRRLSLRRHLHSLPQAPSVRLVTQRFQLGQGARRGLSVPLLAALT